jgi:hypothetical protein
MDVTNAGMMSIVAEWGGGYMDRKMVNLDGIV